LNDERAIRTDEALVEDRLGTRARVFGTEQAILVGILYGDAKERTSLRELESLADTAGIPVLAVAVQRRDRPHPATFVGKGKLAEIKATAEELGADVVIFNEELSPAQARNLEKALGRKAVDRTQLIMDIFAQRAATKEARLQVELAQLHYLLPRLRGWGISLTRAGGRAVGGVGTRGPGETQLELDRNKIYRRIHILERRLKKAAKERDVRRKSRTKGHLPQVALVGYTNSGKSTLLNRLCEADAFVGDKLFATLDTRVRRGEIGSGRGVLFVDTVGFIQDLPHDLVPAFAATLEAAQHADLLLHVVDISKVSWEADHRSVLETLDQEVFHDHDTMPPIITVWNKMDRCEQPMVSPVNGVTISARKGTHIEQLVHAMEEALYGHDERYFFVMPHRAIHFMHIYEASGKARIVEYTELGAHVEATLSVEEWKTLEQAGARIVSVGASSQAATPSLH